MVEFTRKEAKQWARKHYQGLEGVLMPSFVPDLSRLDEEGIRHDVDYSIRHGLFSVFLAAESTSLTSAETLEFMRIACSEAKGRIHLSMPILTNTFAQDVALAKEFERMGGTHALLGCPVQFHPNSEQEIFDTLKAVIDSTNLAIDLYPAARFDLSRFGHGTLSVNVIDRLADIDNLVGVKVGNLNPPNYAAHVYSKVRGRLLVNDPLDQAWAFTTQHCEQQWAGAMGYDMWQTPEDRRAVRMFQHFRAGELDKAMEIYWQIEPVREAGWSLHGRVSSSGLYPFLSFKYQQFLVGGNGGMLRQPIHRLSEAEMSALRGGLERSGIKPYDGSIEEFLVGRAAFRRGQRLPRGAKAVMADPTRPEGTNQGTNHE